MKRNTECPHCGAITVLNHNDNTDSSTCIHSVSRSKPRLKRHSVTIRNFQSRFGVSPVAVVSIDDHVHGGCALRVIDHDGPLMTATAWIPGIPAGHVAVKDHPDVEGCLDQLIRHRIVQPTGESLNGFQICRLGDAFRD